MDRRIKRVTTVLDQQYRDPPSIEQLADEVGLSPSRLTHLFREEEGKSIQKVTAGRPSCHSLGHSCQARAGKDAPCNPIATPSIANQRMPM